MINDQCSDWFTGMTVKSFENKSTYVVHLRTRAYALSASSGNLKAHESVSQQGMLHARPETHTVVDSLVSSFLKKKQLKK